MEAEKEFRQRIEKMERDISTVVHDCSTRQKDIGKVTSDIGHQNEKIDDIKAHYKNLERRLNEIRDISIDRKAKLTLAGGILLILLGAGITLTFELMSKHTGWF